MNTYYEGCNERLLAQIPARHKLLELGCAAGVLGWHYKQAHPSAQWHGVDINEQALQAAAERLDRTHQIDVDREGLNAVGADFDCVVLGDVLEHLVSPEAVLRALHGITTADAQLLCCVPNMAHASVIQRLVAADLEYDDQGLLDRTHLRFLTRSTIVKMLLNAGWSPRIADRYTVEPGNGEFLRGIVAAAAAVGVPEKTALANFSAFQYILECEKLATPKAPELKLAVVVPVNNRLQFASNVARSPGLREIGAQVAACHGASSAADAFTKGRDATKHEWILFCHQDVYFPSGFGHSLRARMDAMTPLERRRSVIGFAGIAVDAQGRTAHSGAVIDRTERFRHPTSTQVVSLDEFAVVMHRDCELRIDPALGWHLWATDLCLQGLFSAGEPVHSSTVDEPIFHNSHNDYELSESFHQSARTLAAKYPQVPVITTLCGNIGNNSISTPGP